MYLHYKSFIGLLPVPLLFVLLLLIAACSSDSGMSDRNQHSDESKSLDATYYYSGFDLGSRSFNSVSEASDGLIYYALSSHEIEQAGQMYSYDPETEEITHLGDLSEISGEGDSNAIPQGKVHTNFFEYNSILYFSTHIGYYESLNGMERYPENIPDGYEPYPGGHFLSYDLESGEFQKLATAPDDEGIVTMTLDKQRGQIYGITWPKGYFIHYDIEQDQLKNLGLISEMGEAGTRGDDYRVLCRAMFVDPGTGYVYYSTADGDIFYYDPGSETISRLEGVDLKKDYFGTYDPSQPGNMGYNWRQIFWYAPEEVAYGVHGTSGYLFRFDPRSPSLELVDRITSKPSQKSGMIDQFHYGYLGMQLGHDGKTLYYLTGGPIYVDGVRVTRDRNQILTRVEGVDNAVGGRAIENLHLVTYNLANRQYRDHGPIFYQDNTRPTFANSIAMDNSGYIYTLANHSRNGNEIQDLVRINVPESLRNN